MKLLFVILFFSCAIQAMLIPIFNDDLYDAFIPPTPKTPPSLLALSMQAIARDRQNFPLQTIALLPFELATPILQIRNRTF